MLNRNIRGPAIAALSGQTDQSASGFGKPTRACFLDPKKEIKDVVVELAGDDLRVFKPGLRGGVRQVIDVMAPPEWSVEADLAAGRVKAAARKMLLRSARPPPLPAPGRTGRAGRRR